MSVMGWLGVAASAVSIGSSAPPVVSQPIQLAQASMPFATAAQSSSYSWETYKVRLAGLARLQGVREPTIQAYVPGLDMNSRVIELERTEPQAHSSNGVVGVLAPPPFATRRRSTLHWQF